MPGDSVEDVLRELVAQVCAPERVVEVGGVKVALTSPPRIARASR